MSATPRGTRVTESTVLLALAVVIFAAVAFNVANLEPLGQPVRLAPAPTPVGPSTTSRTDPLLVAALWTAAAGVFAIIVVSLIRHRKPIRGPVSRWSLLPSLLGILLFFLLLSSMPRTFPNLGNQTAAADGNGTALVPGIPALMSGWPVEAFVVVAIFALILGIAYRARWGPNVPATFSEEPGEEVRPEATAALDDTIRDLEAGADVRAAILACFQRFCGLVRTRGIVDQDPLTAREIEGLAVRTLSISAEASASLTSLFEEARYSEHALGEADRERAIASLGRIRAALEA